MKQARYGIDDRPIFVIDQSRCIGCEACVQACRECGTHRGQSLIHLDRIDRAESPAPWPEPWPVAAAWVTQSCTSPGLTWWSRFLPKYG